MPMTAARRSGAPELNEFREDVLRGLSGRTKAIPCKWLYDRQGGRLFDEICESPEYYVTRTELAILREYAGDIGALAGGGCLLVEFGSGAGIKTGLVLSALSSPAGYVPIDISDDYLADGARRIAGEFPTLPVHPVVGDYMHVRSLPAAAVNGAERLLGFFPGSTIGNLAPTEAQRFLTSAAHLLGPKGALVLGVDLKKDRETLDAAYNDRAGVTAQFTLNLLARINRELDATFDIAAFCHDAHYHSGDGRVEIYLRSLRDQKVSVAGHPFWIAADERIHVEYSYKYTMKEIADLAGRSGFRTVRQWTDERRRFSVNFLAVGRTAPQGSETIPPSA
jgi:dimethylhistidine N-methyltransferase